MSHFKCWLSRAMEVSDKITFDGYEVEFWRYTSRVGEHNVLRLELANEEIVERQDIEIEVVDGVADIPNGDHAIQMTFQCLYNLTMEDLR